MCEIKGSRDRESQNKEVEIFDINFKTSLIDSIHLALDYFIVISRFSKGQCMK